MKDHNLVEHFSPREILVEQRPVHDHNGKPVVGLHSLWITLNNPQELNSYTTKMAKEVILALREASTGELFTPRTKTFLPLKAP